MTDDIAALIDHLGLDRPDVVGYSLGGGVALQTTMRHPDKVGLLVAASANIRSDAIYPEMLEQQRQVGAGAAEFMKETPMYELYARVAPRPEDFPKLLDKIGAALATPFDFTEDVHGLHVPTMLVAADADMAPPSHYVDAFALLDSLAGATRFQLLRFIGAEAALVTTTGAIMATAAATVVILAQRAALTRFSGAAPISIPWTPTVEILGATIAISVLASVLPALRVMRASVVELADLRD